MTSPKPKRRWFRFSLRTLLVIVVVLSVPLAWFAWRLEKARRQREAVEVIVEAGGWVCYDYEIDEDGAYLNYPIPEPTAPRWLRKFLGDDVFCDVVEVNCVSVRRGKRRRWVGVSAQITDADLEFFRRLTGLERLNLHGTHVSDEGLERLTALTSLEFVNLRQTQITEEGVRKLQQALPNCEIVADTHADLLPLILP